MTPVAVGLAEAARMYGVSPDVIRTACKATENHGGIKARKIGAVWSIRVEDLDAWHRSHLPESEKAAS